MVLSLIPIIVEVSTSTAEFGECHEHSNPTRQGQTATHLSSATDFLMTVPQFLPLRLISVNELASVNGTMPCRLSDLTGFFIPMTRTTVSTS